jgi:hypothetical protein
METNEEMVSKNLNLKFKIGNKLNLDQADQSVDAVFIPGLLHQTPLAETGG